MRNIRSRAVSCVGADATSTGSCTGGFFTKQADEEHAQNLRDQQISCSGLHYEREGQNEAVDLTVGGGAVSRYLVSAPLLLRLFAREAV